MLSNIYTLLPAFVIAFLVILIFILYEPHKNYGARSKSAQSLGYNTKRLYREAAVKFYDMLYKFLPTRLFVGNVAAMFKYMYVYSDADSKIYASILLLAEIITGVISYIVGMIYYADTLLAAITTYMLCTVVYIKIRGDGLKFLENLEDCISDMVHMYNAGHQNIDKMFERVLENKNGYMYRYLDQMYTYLKRAHMEVPDQSAIDEYNSICSSRHLRILFNYLYITFRYGDETTSTGGQLFDQNMLAIQREVHSDYMKIRTIKEKTSGEHYFIIFSVLMIPLLKTYMMKYFTFDGFESVTRFLTSNTGYIIKIICALISTLCFFLYSNLLTSNVALSYKLDTTWEEVLIRRSFKLRRFLDMLSPKPGTVKKRKLDKKLSESNIYSGPRVYYLNKIAYCIILTIAVAVFTSTTSVGNYFSIINDYYAGISSDTGDLAASAMDDPEKFKARAITYDAFVIDIVQDDIDTYNALTDEERGPYLTKIIEDSPDIDYGAYVEIAVDRIKEKLELLTNQDPIYLITVIFVSCIFSYMIPDILMFLSTMFSRGSMVYDEVMGYYTVVILLIRHSVANVTLLLKWITSFAVIFKQQLQTCLDNLSEKEILALNDIIEYKPFQRLVECILLSFNGSDLPSAFAGVEQRQLFQEETRKLVTEKLIKQRVFYSEALSWTTLGITFVLYCGVPMIAAIVEMLTQLAF